MASVVVVTSTNERVSGVDSICTQSARRTVMYAVAYLLTDQTQPVHEHSINERHIDTGTTGFITTSSGLDKFNHIASSAFLAVYERSSSTGENKSPGVNTNQHDESGELID